MVLFFISACDLISEITDHDYDTFTIKNETEYTVNIMAYDKYYNNLVDSVAVKREFIRFSDDITIDPYDKFYVRKVTGEAAAPMGAFTREQVDSVIITFNNSKIITYLCKAYK